MTEQEKQKLNEKLARWRFPALTDGMHAEKGLKPFFIVCENEEVNTDLTDSLDACFQWLVPKLYLLFIEMENLKLIPESSSHQSHEWAKYELCKFLETEWLHRIIFPSKPWETFGQKDLSLALCLAIEKLIDTQTE